MHIPDGFIPLWQCAIYWTIAIIFLIFAFRWGRKNLSEKNIPLFAVLAAGIFAIMSMNIPVPFGSSGHMVGAAMVAIIFMSPWAAVIVIALVLMVQGIFFGDGGITTMGANILNMGVAGGFVGYYVWKGLYRPYMSKDGILKGLGVLGKRKWWAIGIASWIAIFYAACQAAIEMWLAGTFPLGLGLFYMGGYHAMIGIFEAIITVIVISTIEKVRPDLLAWNRLPRAKTDDIIPEPSEPVEVGSK
ncbi:MAG: cobalt transporter CbiM [Methanobacterium sp.]|uniref:cobalt transporter CbiM n=1 Tax=Methanobacterium sp. TaxID=2164 RepID=UPI003C74B795